MLSQLYLYPAFGRIIDVMGPAMGLRPIGRASAFGRRSGLPAFGRMGQPFGPSGPNGPSGTYQPEGLISPRVLWPKALPGQPGGAWPGLARRASGPEGTIISFGEGGPTAHQWAKGPFGPLRGPMQPSAAWLPEGQPLARRASVWPYRPHCGL